MFCFSPLKQCKQEYRQLIKRKHELTIDEDTQSKQGDEFDLVDRQIKELIEGRYSETIFQYYKKRQPMLIRIHTGEEVSWKDAFGESFEAVSMSLRHSLVGLIEGGGKYRLK